MSKFLDLAGLTYLYGKIKEMLDKKVDKAEGKDLSSNDFSAELKAKLEGIDNNANKYTHPQYTERESGLYKITVDETGHVSDATAIQKQDIVDLGIPEENTTYDNASEESAGLMSQEDYKKLSEFSDAADYALKTDLENIGTITTGEIDEILAA